MKLAGHILRADDSDPLRQINYQPSTAKPFQIRVRRAGRARQQWLACTNESIYATLSNSEYTASEVLAAATQREI